MGVYEKRHESKARKRARKAARERKRRDERVTEEYGRAAHGSCGRKVRYHSLHGANQVAMRHPGEKLVAYRCEYCGGWHLTSHPRRAPVAEIGGRPLTVLEVLSQARDAAIEIRRIEEQAEARLSEIGVQGHGFDAHGKNGVLDPMRKVDDLIDWQDEHVAGSGLVELVEEGWEVVSGIAEVADDAAVEAVTRYYLQGESWAEIAPDVAARVKSLAGMGRAAQVRCLVAAVGECMERWEEIGIARLKEMGNR